EAVLARAAEGEGRVEAGRPVGVVDLDQIVGQAEQRHGEMRGADGRRLDLRLAEAGDEACRIAVRLYREGAEMAFEEVPAAARHGIALDGIGEGITKSDGLDPERAGAIGRHQRMK